MTSQQDSAFSGNRATLRGGDVRPAGGMSAGQLVATLPLPAVVVPDFPGVRRVGKRVAEQLSGPGPAGKHAAPVQRSLPRVFDGYRFLLFSAIGGFVFLLGFGVQVWLTSGLRVAPIVSYLVQALLSIEASFLLNRWLTWRDRDTPFWRAFARFNAQKTVTVALNMAMYAGLLWLGMNYLIANIVLTALFTIVNFVAGDRFVFVPAGSRLFGGTAPPVGTIQVAVPGEMAVPGAVTAPDDAAIAAPASYAAVPAQRVGIIERTCAPVSVVIPCRGNERTIGPAVRSLLDQDYPGFDQIILIGSPGDSTWAGLAGIDEQRVVTLEIETPPGLRDANYKRNAGIRGANSDLIALVDSDIVLPSDWMGRAVAALERSDANCVAGGMRSIHDSYWGRYTDGTRLGAKTPRIDMSYPVTKKNFGAGGRKPPITANTLFTREMYDGCPIDASWSHGSYEDYEWFWRVVNAGFSVEVRQDLFGWHHHRRGVRPLVKEHLRSSRGCAYFIRAHRDSPFARRRLCQAIGLPLGGLAGVIAVSAAIVAGYGAPLGIVALAATVGFAADQIVQSRRLESLLYPLTGLGLGLVFTAGLVTNLIRAGVAGRSHSAAEMAVPVPSGQLTRARSEAAAAVANEVEAPQRLERAAGQPESLSGPLESQDPPRRQRRGWRRLLHPLTVICALQAALSLTLVWSNSAFTDEADYLWIGRLVVGHWLHNASWPATYGERQLPGSPIIYPPLGALASSLGGLAAARIEALAFMLGATILLYFTSRRLVGQRAANFATTLWVLTEPVIRLTFATADPLAIFLVALCAWLIVQAGHRRRHGELVAVSAAALALANAASYSATLIDPVVIAFAFFVWLPRLRQRQAAYSTAWLAGAWAIFLGVLLTFSRSWVGFTAMAFGRDTSSHQSAALVFTDIWAYSGLIIILGLIGASVARSTQAGGQAALVAVLGCAALIVPAAQVLGHTADLMDRRLAFGIWFAAIAAGFGCASLIRWLPGGGKSLAAAACAVAVGYLGFGSWQSASEVFHGWPNSKSFVAAFKPYAARSDGLIFAASQEHVAQYYTKQGDDWTRWNSQGLTLNPGTQPTIAYYTKLLRHANYGLVALFYSTSFTAASLPTSVFTSSAASRTATQVFGSAGGPTEPGLEALTAALREDHAYRLVGFGPYDNAKGHGSYAIWRRVTKK